MAGFVDGMNLEERSVPLIKLEVDVATAADLQALSTTVSNLSGNFASHIGNTTIHHNLGSGTNDAAPGDLFSQHANDSTIHFTLASTTTGVDNASTGSRSNHNHNGVYATVSQVLTLASTVTGSDTATTASRSDHNHNGTYATTSSLNLYAPKEWLRWQHGGVDGSLSDVYIIDITSHIANYESNPDLIYGIMGGSGNNPYPTLAGIRSSTGMIYGVRVRKAYESDIATTATNANHATTADVAVTAYYAN